MGKVLVACEESQAVCIAFRERGREAYSCDIQPCNCGDAKTDEAVEMVMESRTLPSGGNGSGNRKRDWRR